MPALPRSPRLGYPAKGAPGEAGRELPGVGCGGGGGDQHRVGAGQPTEPQQPLQHVVEVAAEDAAVGVQLVEHDPAQLAQKGLPARPVAEDSEVQHVGIGDQHPREALLDLVAQRARRVAVVDLARGAPIRQAGGRRQGVELALLVLAQRLERIEKEGPARLAQDRPLQDREMEDQRLAGGGGSGHQNVLAAARGAQALGLMAPEPLHAGGLEGGRDRGRQRRIELAVARRGRLEIEGMQELRAQLAVRPQRLHRRSGIAHAPMISTPAAGPGRRRRRPCALPGPM